MNNCGTCKHWNFDRYGNGERVGQCRNKKVLYRHINPYAEACGWKVQGVGRKESDKCEEWEKCALSR